MADARPFHWEYEPPRVPRERFLVTGGKPLDGTIRVSGAKNAALKMLAAATLTGSAAGSAMSPRSRTSARWPTR